MAKNDAPFTNSSSSPVPFPHVFGNRTGSTGIHKDPGFLDNIRCEYGVGHGSLGRWELE